MKTLILNHQQILQKIDRLAWQLYENHHEKKELVMVAVGGRGEFFANLLRKKLESISGIGIIFSVIKLDKKDPLSVPLDISEFREHIQNRAVIFVDDVLNTGKTLIYAIQPFLSAGASCIETVVLADRDHKQFPVSATYVGVSLATTLQEHITFDVQDSEMSVYLD